MKIAFLDSGIGGLSVLKEAYQLLPNEDYIYYADSKNAPYGSKTKQKIREHVLGAVDFLVDFDIKMLVVACNTATSAVIDDLRIKYSFPIIGMEPAIKPAIKQSNGRRVLVLATTFTAAGGPLSRLITQLGASDSTDVLALDKLVKFAEDFDFDSPEAEEYIQSELKDIKTEDYGAVVLGCTHFIFYKPIIEKIFPDSDVVDGNIGTAKNMINILKKEDIIQKQGEGSLTFYSSGAKESEEKSEKLKNMVIT
jgi:glutamate racemase